MKIYGRDGVRVRHGLVLLPLLPLLLWAFQGGLFQGSQARAATMPHNITLGTECYDCHHLSTLQGEPGTSFINRASSTLPDMKIINGGAAPGIFGCTYCHNKPLRSVMKDAMGDFQSQTSMHFVGRTMGGTNTNNEYVSNFIGTNWSGGVIASELQCVDCHSVQDPGNPYPGGDYGYPDHLNVTGGASTTNPNYLKNFTTAAAYPYNDSCVQTCHSGAAAPVASGATVPAMGHLGWGAYDPTGAGGNPRIREPRGADLLEVRCQICHDTHSSNKPNLFSDGTDGTAAIDDMDCTAVCHVGGAPASGYRTEGHGKLSNRENTAIIDLTCQSCHNSGVSHREATNPKRLNISDVSETPAGVPHDGIGNGLDDDYDGIVDNPGESAWHNPQRTICRTCHSQYQAHSGAILNGSGYGSASCVDCHDPHGKDTGANIEMVRSNIVGEPTTFVDTSGMAGTPDFYRSEDSAGVCDNMACHGKPLGDNATSGTVLYSGPDVGDGPGIGDHTGVTTDYDCLGCHTHVSRGTSPSFKPQCDICHGYPPTSTDSFADNTTGGVGVHARHTALGLGCEECHYRDGSPGNTHNESAWSVNQGYPINRAYVDVVFMPRGTAPNYTANRTAVYNPVNQTCSSVTCHNPDSVTAGVGITGKSSTPTESVNTQPKWEGNDSGGYVLINGCVDPDGAGPGLGCHVTSAAANPDGGSHYVHDNAGQKNLPCTDCHNGYFSAGTHANLTLDVTGLITFGGTLGPIALSGAYADGPTGVTGGVCSAVYCHGGTSHLSGAAGLDTTPEWGNATTGQCGDCHSPGNIPTRQHTTHLTATFGPFAACSDCHTDAASAYHVDGIKTFKDAPTPQDLANTTLCDTCHGDAAGGATAKVEWMQVTGHWRTTGTYYCEHCHDATPSTVSTAAGTGGNPITAPQVMGDFGAGDTYGATITGHNRAAGNYPVSDNPPAAQVCVSCHRYSALHINGVDGSAYTDARIGTVNGFNLSGAGFVIEDVCFACHQNGLGTQLSTHGNANGAFAATDRHDPAAETFAYRCDACHEPHGMTQNTNGNPNVFMVKPSVEVMNYSQPGTGANNTNVVNVVFENVEGVGSFDDGSGSGVCQACHASPVRPGSGSNLVNLGGQHSTLNVYANNEQGNDCSGCHAHEYDAVLTTPDAFMPKGCDGCHGYPPPTMAHDTHFTTYGFSCSTCHQNSGFHNELKVVDTTDYAARGLTLIRQNTDVVFDPAVNPDGFYSQSKVVRTGAADGTCAALYCHGAGTTALPNGSTFPAHTGVDVAPEWNGTAACGVACHGAIWPSSAGTQSPDSNEHNTHVNPAGYNFACTLCHYSTVTTQGSGATVPVVDPAFHANTIADVVFDGADPRLHTSGALPYSTYAGDSVAGSGYGPCDNTYCHSNGRDLVAPFTDPYNTAMNWDGTGGYSSCGPCHGFGPTGYANNSPKANQHAPHSSGMLDGITCLVCHYSWSVDSNTYHVNGQYDVDSNPAPPALDDFAYTYGPTGGTCDNANCHGGNSGVWWGYDGVANGHFTCDVCHSNSNGAPVAGDTNNFATSVVSPTAVMSKVAPAEYNAVGHGTGGPAKNCADCHDSDVPHDTSPAHDLAGTNPFRLVDNTGGSGFTCTDPAAGCHPSTAIGTNTGLALDTIRTHSKAVMEAVEPGSTKYTWTFTPECVNCHDPHGDGANIAMIQRELYDKAQFGVPAGPPPPMPTEQLALVFTDNANATGVGQTSGGASYAQSVFPFSSVCQECHEDQAAAGDEMFAFRDDTNASAVPHQGGTGNPGDCSTCHPHNEGFKPSACNDCHGADRNVAGTDYPQYWPDGAGGKPAYVDNQAGAHDNHVLLISTYLGYGSTLDALVQDPNTDTYQKDICAFCHPDPGGTAHTANVDLGASDPVDRVSVYRDTDDTGAQTDVFTKFIVGAGNIGPDVDGTNANQAYNYTAATCANLVCHNRVTTPATWNAPPDWAALPPDSQCSNISCHGAASYSNAHAAHVVDRLAAEAGSGYACTECHLDNGSNLRHQNGQVDMLFTLASSVDQQFGGGTTGYYDKDNSGTSTGGDTAFAYRSGSFTRTCYNIYCHGADSSWGGADTTPVWDTPATATCYGASTCHNAYGSPFDQSANARNPITTGSHQIHMTQWTAASGVEAANPRGPRMSPHPASLSGSSQHSCDACHNIRTEDTACISCHNGSATGASLPTLTHADGRVDFTGTITGPSPLTITAVSLAATNACDECHGGAAPAVTAKANWAAGTAVACESCHGDNTAARSRRNIGWPAEASVDAPVRAGAVFDSAGHGKVTDNVTYGGSACVDCHNEGSQHFTQRTGSTGPALGDMNRLDVLGGNDYGVVPNTFCGTCHSGPVETVHFTNANTAGGSSDNGDMCSICHDPHGQAGQDAMIVPSVPVGGAISGFADKAQRSSYWNASNHGVCQSCHDQAEVIHFNRTTEENATHEPGGGVCTACHTHSSTVAFSANCFNCHGDTATGNYYYPDGAAYPDRAGAHAAHVTRIAAVNGLSAADASTCVWCHPGGGHSGDQASPPADLVNGTTVRLKTITGADNDRNSSIVQGPGTDVSCSNVNCHYNSDYTGAGLPDDWYQAGSQANCSYCHNFTTYTAAALPNAHDVHVDEPIDGGYNWNGSTFGCFYCHPSTVSNSHQDGDVDMDFSGTLDPSPGSPRAETYSLGTNRPLKYGGGVAGDYGTCSAFFCHGNFTGGVTGNTPSWFTLSSGDCGTCHGVTSTEAATLPMTNGHPKHAGDAAGQRQLGCESCHYNTTQDGTTIFSTTAHVNGQSAVSFTPEIQGWSTLTATYNGTTNVGDSVTDNSDTCGSLYCHSDMMGQAAGNYRPVQWNAGPLPCGTCHTSGGASGNHARHTSSGTKNYACSVCHEGRGDETLFHADHIVQNDYSSAWNGLDLSNGGTWDYGGTDVPYDGYGTCDNLFCHGDFPGGNTGNSPLWGGTAVCGTCHNQTTANQVSGSHADHFNSTYGPGMSLCSQCHTNSTITTATHVNGRSNFTDGNSVPVGGIAADLAVTLCNTCHGITTYDTETIKANWSDTNANTYYVGSANPDVTCESCHGAGDALAVINITTAPDMMGDLGAGDTYGSSINGHTNTTGYASGNAGASKQCVTCHDEATAHIGGGNQSGFGPHRLDTTINGVGSISTIEGVCDACHQNAGGDQGTQVSRHGNSGTGYTPIEGAFTVNCTVCHEAHGKVAGAGTVNWSMFRRSLVTPNNATQLVTLLARTGADSFDEPGDAGTFNNLDDACVTCHLTGGAAGTTLVRHTTSPAGGGIHENNPDFVSDEIGSNCISCHTHDFDGTPGSADGFAPLQCDGCHGFPPNATDGFLDNPDAVGVHARHVTDYGYGCGECHFGNSHNNISGWTGYPGTPVPAANVDVGFDTTGGWNGSAAYNAGTNTCDNVTCHNPDDTTSGVTGKSSVVDSNHNPQWLNTITPVDTCLGCHEMSPVANPDGGSHYRHDNTAAYGYACTYCHSDVNVSGGATRATHADKTVDTAGVVTFGNALGGVAALSGTWVNAANSCQDVYCHGEFTGGNTVNNPVWTTGTGGACGDCHGATAAAPPTANAHGKHTGSGAGQRNLGCQHCHNGTTTDGLNVTTTAVHADGWSAVGFSATVQGWSVPVAVYNGTATVGDNVADGTDTCSSLFCHSDVTSASAGYLPVQWNAGALACGACHAAGGGSAPHAVHTAAGNKNYACSVCHEGVGDETTSHADHLVQNNFSTNWNGLDLSNAGAWDYSGTETLFDGVGNCNNLYCHGDFNGGNNANAQLWSGSAVCGTCHLNPPNYGSHPTHFNSTYGPGIGDCTTTCHSPNGPAHVNGTKSFQTKTIPPLITTETDLAGTGACNACHGNVTGTVAGAKYDWIQLTVKPEWATESVGDYSDITCESCHGLYDPANSTGNGAGTPAPNVMGDNALYGSAFTGHNATAAYASGNPPANKTCVLCHNEASTHIGGGDGTGFVAHRLDSSINGVGAIATVEGVCDACHQNTGGDQGTQVSRHGNSAAGGYTPIEANFTVNCTVCHEVHGMVNGGGTVNWSMFRYGLTTPNNGVQNVQLTARTGANSFDEGGETLTSQNLDDACATCHLTAGGGGTTLANHNSTAPMGGGIHENNPDYTGDATGANCIACHTHSYDGSPATADGFAPLQCDGCHGYPPNATDGFLDNADAVGVHARHVTDYGYGCPECHINTGLHNQSLWSGYPGTLIPAGNVTVVFDTTGGWNGSASYNTGSNTCDNVTCHNPDDTTSGVTGKSSVVDSNHNPQWLNSFTPVDTCLGCHETSPATNPDGGNHYGHDNAATHGYACTICHSDVNVSGGATRASHADRLVTTSGVVTISGTLGAQPIGGAYNETNCTAVYCHNNAATPAWTAAATGACTVCHTPGGAGLDPVSGLHDNTPAPTVSGVAHDDSFGASGTCTSCHTTLAAQATHVNGSFTANGSIAANRTAMGLFAAYTSSGSDNTGSCSGAAAGAAGCHDGAGDQGSWARRWNAAISYASDGATECGGCHGTWASGWNWVETADTDHTNPSGLNPSGDAMGVAAKHPDCDICHGWTNAAYNQTWAGTSNLTYVGHGDEHITMNGPDQDIPPFTIAGAEYDDNTGGCAAACHLITWTMNTNSGWPANYGDFGAGACEGCHDFDGPGPNVMGDGIDGTGTFKPYDDGNWGFNVNGHGADGTATNTPAGLTPNRVCIDCHDTGDPSSGAGAHNNGTLNSVENGTNPSTNTAHLIAAFIDSTPTLASDVQTTADSACATTAGCHPGNANPMDHSTALPVGTIGPVQLGNGSTPADGDTVLVPVDDDLTTYAPKASPDFAPCFSCHNPHGTNTAKEGTRLTNKMLRTTFTNSALCALCHGL